MHINIHKYNSRPMSRGVSTNCKLLNPNERYILTITDKEMVFKLASFAYVGKTYSPCITNYPWKNMNITAPELNTGQYQIDKNSTEDEIIVILKD